MSLSKEQVWKAWESWRMQEAARLTQSIRDCTPEELPQPVADLAGRGLAQYIEGITPLPYAFVSTVRLAFDFGYYLANLEREEASLTVDEHDGTVLNIIPYAGEGPHEDGRFRKEPDAS